MVGDRAENHPEFSKDTFIEYQTTWALLNVGSLMKLVREHISNFPGMRFSKCLCFSKIKIKLNKIKLKVTQCFKESITREAGGIVISNF